MPKFVRRLELVENMIEIEDFYETEIVKQSSAPLVGLELESVRNFSLVDNFYKKRINKKDIGSDEWIDRLLQLTRKKIYPDLKSLIGTEADPITPPVIKHLQSRFKRPFLRGSKHHRFYGQKLPKRLEGAALRLLECPREWLWFVTIVTSANFSYQSAIDAIAIDGKKLDRFLRKRMPNSRMALIPEVSIHRLSEMNDGLFPDARWRAGKSPDQVVYKVHFHCVFYCPGKNAHNVEHELRFYENGKRTPYSGEQQVRALPLKDDPKSKENRPDVLGVLGYSTKGHFKGPNKRSTFEAFPEWLLVQSHIHNNDDLVRVINMRKELTLTCRCGSKHPDTEQCPDCCNPSWLKVDHDFYGDHTLSKPKIHKTVPKDSYHDSKDQLEDDSNIIVNCPRPTQSKEKQKIIYRTIL